MGAPTAKLETVVVVSPLKVSKFEDLIKNAQTGFFSRQTFVLLNFSKSSIIF